MGHNEYAELQTHRRFLEEVEMAVRAANQEIIHEHISNLTRENFHRLAVVVAKKRAEYLDAVMKMDWAENRNALTNLRQLREDFDEATQAFDAMQRTIERGYVKISD